MRRSLRQRRGDLSSVQGHKRQYAMQWQIKRITATPVNLAYRNIPVMTCGAIATSTRTIIEIETSNGLIGLGEASYAPAAAIIEREFAAAILGLDATDHALIKRHCLPRHLDFGTPGLKLRLAAWGGLEIALWDLLGKIAGLPVYRLLGGACRARAPFVAYAYASPRKEDAIEKMIDRALRSIDESGASIFEFKVGVHPVDVEIDMVKAVHAAMGGRARIAVDANMGWTVGQASQFLAATSPLLDNIEEPVADLAEMERIAKRFDVKVSTHCSDLDVMRQYPGIQGIVPTLDVCGGIAACRRQADVYGALGRDVWLRSHAESGIGWAAMVHLGISVPNLHRPAQALIDLMADDLVLGETWNVREGGVRPPERPGLGVDLDRDAVRRCHEAYLAEGEVQAFSPDPGRP
jgi:glucarate dehydratase